MSVTTDVTRGAQEQMLESIELTQKAALEGFRVWAEAVDKIIPETPAGNFWDEWPSVEESIDNTFDFAGKLLANQRAFTKSILQTTRPAAKRAAEEATSAPKRTAAQRAAEEATSAPKRTAAQRAAEAASSTPKRTATSI